MASLTLTSSIHPSQGFHPTTKTILWLSNISSLNDCTVHLYFHLPPLVFIDPYELMHWNAHYTFKHWGTTDLEKPNYALDVRGTDLLLEINRETQEGDTIVVEVPMHLRYGKPEGDGESSGYEEARIDWPKGFLGCDFGASLPKELSTISPSKFLPEYISTFIASSSSSSESTFLAILPVSQSHGSNVSLENLAYDVVHVPVGRYADLAFVETGTAMIVLLCFFWLVWGSLRTITRLNKQRRRVAGLKTE